MARKRTSRIHVPRRPIQRPTRRFRYLTALIRFEAKSASIQAWVPATRAPRRPTTHPVSITKDDWENFPPGAGEIIASFHDRRGNFLDGAAWWARPDYFGDRLGGKKGQLTGGPLPPRVDVRMLHAEVPARAAFLVFHRVRVESARGRRSRTRARGAVAGNGHWGPVRLVIEPLASFTLPHLPPISQDDLPAHYLLPFFSFDVLKLLRNLIAEMFPSLGWVKSKLGRKGWVEGKETIFDGGSPEGRFNIIILGDGFADDELTTFNIKADGLATKILETEPFLSLKDYIRITVVRCVSNESGITRCPGDAGFDCTDDYEVVETFFESEGCWVNEADPSCLPSSPTYFGVEHPEYVYEAAADVAGYDEVGLYILLTNVDIYGGSAFRSQKLAFVPVYADDATFFNLGLHESAHVLGDLLEEYTSPLPWDGSTCRNVVYEDDMEAVWWTALATASELHAGTLKKVFTCPDGAAPGACETEYNDPYLSDAADPDVLGLFWGAQFIDSEDDPCAENLDLWDAWTNKKGNHFYRAMARCRMRVVDWEYCRVCSHEIEDAIRGGLV